MNSYRELVAKLEAIQNRVEEGAQMAPPSTPELPIDECGEMPLLSHSAPGQSNSVTMNVSMNGSGAGGIRDLMAILKNIEDAGEPAHEPHGAADMIVGMDDAEMEEEIDGGFQSATTEPSEETAGIDAVTRTGNDLASKGSEAPKVNGGGNPFVKEGLLNHLTNLYKEVKERDLNVEEGIASAIGSAVGGAVQGVKNAVSDVQQGYQQATAPAQGAAPATTTGQGVMSRIASQSAKPATNPEMVKIAQGLAAGTIPQDQAMAQLMKLAGQTKPPAPSPVGQVAAAKPAAVSPKAAAGFKDSDW
jgi:hypothetical protein